MARKTAVCSDVPRSAAASQRASVRRSSRRDEGCIPTEVRIGGKLVATSDERGVYTHHVPQSELSALLVPLAYEIAFGRWRHDSSPYGHANANPSQRARDGVNTSCGCDPHSRQTGEV